MPLNDTAAAATTTALRALGVAIFAGVGAMVGVLIRWLIHLDGAYDPANEYFANFLIAVGSVVGLGALLLVAQALVTIPKRPEPDAD